MSVKSILAHAPRSCFERCVARLPKKRKFIGLLEPGSMNKYRHPLPSLHEQQRIWVEQMIEQFEE